MLKFQLIVTLMTALLLSTPGQIQAKKAPPIKTYQFAGLRLGHPFSQAFRRAPYNKPCDDDPVEKRDYRGIFYAATPCRGRTFPAQTSAIVYLKYQKARYAAPVRAFVFLGGRYFKKHSNFPVHPGDSLGKARRVFGRVLWRGSVSRKGSILRIHAFAGPVFILAQDSRVVGVALGDMPRNTKAERWRAVAQIYQRYTPKPGTPPASKAKLYCNRLVKKAKRCSQKSVLARSIARRASRFLKRCQRRFIRDWPLISCILRHSCRKMDRCR